MANDPRDDPSPNSRMSDLKIFKSINIIAEAFFANPKDAKKLVIEALTSMHEDSQFGHKKLVDNAIVKAICTLMTSIRPRGNLEALFAAQLVISHCEGIRLVASSFKDDRRLGIRMLKHCQDVLERAAHLRDS